MYQKLRDVTLKNSEAVELGVVVGPDESEAGEKLRRLLGHKGQIWRWQIEQSLRKRHPGIENRFYVLSKNGLPFANIMCCEKSGVGIFGHVYTAPEERRKGAAEVIHTVQLEDFKQRGGRALYLGTVFDTPPWHLYARHGFQAVEAGSDFMYWFAQSQQQFETETFAPSSVRYEPLGFQHWPVLPALTMMNHPARIRIAGMDVINPSSSEGGALDYLAAMDPDYQSEKKAKGARAWVAVSERSGMPVALAAVRPDAHFWNQAELLDLFAAPGFERELPALFEKLKIARDHSVFCYADYLWPAKQQALKACGFSRAALLKQHLRSPAAAHDVELWTLDQE